MGTDRVPASNVKGWEQAPTGEALEEAILQAHRSPTI